MDPPAKEKDMMKRSVSYDSHGFIVNEETARDAKPRQEESDCQLIDNWTSVCERWHHVQNMSPLKVRNLLKKGLPLELRPRVWKLFLNSDAPKQQKHFDYQSNVKALMVMLEDYGVSDEKGYADLKQLNKAIAALEQQEQKNNCKTSLVHLRQILMDIDRTFPEHRLFSTDGPGKSSLLHILAVYSQYNPTVGYCQGMSYVAAMLLMYLDEEDAFWAIVSLFEGPKYLANFYDTKFAKLQRFAEVFSMLLKERQCQLAKHLDGLGLHPLMYTVPWFLCLFTFLPCWDTVLLICDLLLLEGVTALLRAGLAIMEQLSNELQAMDNLGEAIHFIQNPPVRLVSRTQMAIVLWRRSNHVDKQEMDALLDIAVSSSNTEGSSSKSPAKSATKSSRKRPREEDSKPEEQSTTLFSRMMETPAKKLRQLTNISSSSFSTAKRILAVRTRKIALKSQATLNGMSPSAVELMPVETNAAFFLNPSPIQNPIVWQGLDSCTTPYIFNSQVSPQTSQSVPVRRSARQCNNMRPSPNIFNNSIIQGPVASNPEEQLAFRTFNTPAPPRSHQETSSSSTRNDHILSPEVELKDFNNPSNNSPLNKALFTDEQ